MSEFIRGKSRMMTTLSQLQLRVLQWCMDCFGIEVTYDKTERCYRFLEESLELVQAAGCSKEDVLRLVEYTYNREPGEVLKEVGDVMITFASLANAHSINIGLQTDIQCASNDVNMLRIRDKHFKKPIQSRSSLPGDVKILEPAYCIKYDDPSRPDETFFGSHADIAAHERFKDIGWNWNAHLFMRIAANARDAQ
jgi:NTP pyrophosphatase (non-canonical NTP hydrolase)